MDSTLYSYGNSEVRSRVLLVDDQDSVRDPVYRILERGGYDVLSASNGPDALAICRKSSHPIELLVTDYDMPEMTGLELARQCLRLNSELRVLYISGSNPDEELRVDLEGRKRGFLAKPFRGDDLLRKAKELLLMEPYAPWPQSKPAGAPAISVSAAKGISH